MDVGEVAALTAPSIAKPRALLERVVPLRVYIGTPASSVRGKGGNGRNLGQNRLGNKPLETCATALLYNGKAKRNAASDSTPAHVASDEIAGGPHEASPKGGGEVS